MMFGEVHHYAAFSSYQRPTVSLYGKLLAPAQSPLCPLIYYICSCTPHMQEVVAGIIKYLTFR